jgi:hypothetical protein
MGVSAYKVASSLAAVFWLSKVASLDTLRNAGLARNDVY